MNALCSGLVALTLLGPSSDPRAIAPDANRPEIVGGPTTAKTPKTRPPKPKPKPKPTPTPTPTPKAVPEPPPRAETPPDKNTVPEPPKKDPPPEKDPPAAVETPATVEPPPKKDPPVETQPPSGDPSAADPPQQDADPGKCFPARGRCRRLNIAGIVAASVGVGMLGTGVGFMQAPEFPIADEPTFNRSLRPPGVVLVAFGAVTIVTGALMIVAGHASHNKRRREGKTARVALTPGGLRW